VYDPSWVPCERTSVVKRPRSSVSVPRQMDDADHDEVIAEVDVPVTERERQAHVYLDAVPGTQEGTGADRSCSSLTMRMLCGFALPTDTVLKMLAEWGQRTDQLDSVGGWYPWSEMEIARKIEWCLGQEYGGEVGDKLHATRDLGDMEAQADKIVEPIDIADVAAPTIVINPKDQLETASKFFHSEFGGDTLIHHHGTWYRWNGKHYKAVTDDDIKARLWRWLGSCSCWSKPSKTEAAKLKQYQPSRNVVTGIMDALKAVANQSSSVEMPCWLNVPGSPQSVIAFDNGLLDVEEYLSGSATLLDHTPDWFSTNCLPHQFNEKATCSKWLDFLNQVFDGDEERIRTLQQWFGYNLIAGNRWQVAISARPGSGRRGRGVCHPAISVKLETCRCS